MENLEQKIEAILFWRAEPITKKELGKILSVTEPDLDTALSNLETTLANRGIVLQRKDDEVTLVTSTVAASLIETLTREELSRDLGKAGLETLTIILYRGPITRRGIDYIRGVNSTFIIRNLLIRGLVEKIQNPNDLRGFLYRATFELLSHLGIKAVTELPEYQTIQEEIKAFEQTVKNTESESGSASNWHIR